MAVKAKVESRRSGSPILRQPLGSPILLPPLGSPILLPPLGSPILLPPLVPCTAASVPCTAASVPCAAASVEGRAEARTFGIASAFTLLELIVVVAVIATLAAIAVPAYQRVTQGGYATACGGHLRQLGVALNGYLADNNMIMPVLKAGREKRTDSVPVLDNTLDKYVADPRLFACPADRHWAAVTGTSYHWNVALNGQSAVNLNFLRFITNPSRIPVLGDKEGFHPYLETKVNILYADGHTSKEISFFTGN